MIGYNYVNLSVPMPEKRKHRVKDTSRNNPDRSGKKLFALILTCFFISGLTGLIYEILWTRMIVKVIGSAPFAVSIILTVFMGGLGLGSYIAGSYVDRIKDPLKLVRLYGILEIAIGVYGIILPLLLILFKPVYALVYNNFFEYFFGYTLFTFAGCFILLIIPVTFMGATLPILSRFFITNISNVSTNVGRLYGLNTIGAASGSLLCGFWLIENLGVIGTLFSAIALNIIIGLICFLVYKNTSKRRDIPESVKESSVLKREEDCLEPNRKQSQLIDILVLVLFAVSGFCSMGYEVIWTKLLGLIIGPTTYSFTIVLVTFVTGLALGSLFFGRAGDSTKDVRVLLIITQTGAALSALLFSQIMGNSQLFFAKLIYHFKDSFALLAFLKSVLLFLFMFLPTFCLGASFPLVGKIYTRTLSNTGRSIGTAYSINSLGSVLGAFCAGFVLIPLVGKENGVSVLVGMQLFSALLFLFFLVLKERWRNNKRLLILAPAVLGLVLIFFYPHWDRILLSKGRYHRYERYEISKVSWLKTLFMGNSLFPEDKAGELVYFGDGIGGFTTVIKHKIDIFGNENLVLYNSGKPDASSRMDMDTQTLLAHFPMIFHENPKNVLVVGLASGITAGEILHYPIEKLDIVDINKQVVKASNLFIPWNNNVLNDSRTELIIQDGRAHLELSDRKYDVISSEPSNPWMAGLASLFTEEFFSLVKDRLNNDGIFVQMFHAYQMDWDTFAMLGRTFSKVFPNSLLVGTNPISLGPDFLFVGFNGNHRLRDTVAKKNLHYAARSKNVAILDHRIFYNLIVNEDLDPLFENGPVNTDYMPLLEFSAPRLMHYFDMAIIERIVSRPWFTENSMKILSEINENINIQVDFVAYALPMSPSNINFESPIDLNRASSRQKIRLAELMEKYCTANVVSDFSFLEDTELKKRCILAQLSRAINSIESSPSRSSLYLHIGNLYLRIGEPSSSIEFYQKALNLNKNNYLGHFRLANTYFYLGKFRLALDHYQKSLNIRPGFSEARVGKERTLKRLRSGQNLSNQGFER